MNTKENFTKIPYELIRGCTKLEKDKLAILTILLMTRTTKNMCIFSKKNLIDNLNISAKNKGKLKRLDQIMNEFYEEDILVYYNTFFPDEKYEVMYEDIGKTDIVYAKVFESDMNVFTKAYDEDIMKIIDYCKDSKNDVYGILSFYVYIMSCINNNPESEYYKLAFPSHELIMLELGMSKNTVIKYKQVLKELDILDYNYIGYDSKGMSNTYYCRKKDKKMLENRMLNLQVFFHKQKLSEEDKSNLNKRRSLKQKINKLINKEDKTEIEKIQLKEYKKEYESLKK